MEDTGKDIDIREIEPSVTFCHVSFRYGDELEDAVNDISFKIEPGKTVAFVGSSGAGKSTCMNLLLRYWDVGRGDIMIGNKNLREISLDSLHNLTTVVLQDVYLFRESIRENIRLGKPEATDEEVEPQLRKLWPMIL